MNTVRKTWRTWKKSEKTEKSELLEKTEKSDKTEKDKLSMSGFFTRLDNFLSKGLDEEFQKEKSFYENEKKELATIKSLRGAGFEQADELEVAKHNHNAVLRELNYMRDCKDYVPKFKPLTVEEHRANKAKEQTLLQPKNSMTMSR